jgi:hypothetical protein
MASKESNIKGKVAAAYQQFQLKGLNSYGKYLEKEIKNSKGKDSKKMYFKYLEKELSKNIKRIDKIKASL